MLTGPEKPPLSGTAPRHIVIFLHGLGADGADLLPLADVMGEYLPDTLFVAPNAPHDHESGFGGYQWFSLTDRDESRMLTGVQQAAPALNAYIDQLMLQHNLTIDRIAVVGFSQGTMTALYTLLRREHPCAAIVGFSGALIGSKLLPSEIKSRPPVCLIHGSADQVLPFGLLGHAKEGLEAAGIEVETHARPGLAHGIDAIGLKLATDFLRQRLA